VASYRGKRGGSLLISLSLTFVLQVYLVGSWDDWSEKTPLEEQEDGFVVNLTHLKICDLPSVVLLFVHSYFFFSRSCSI